MTDSSSIARLPRDLRSRRDGGDPEPEGESERDGPDGHDDTTHATHVGRRFARRLAGEARGADLLRGESTPGEHTDARAMTRHGRSRSKSSARGGPAKSRSFGAALR